MRQVLGGGRERARGHGARCTAWRHAGDVFSAAGGGKASKGREGIPGKDARSARQLAGRRSENGMNPRVGSALQYTRTASEEKAAEVVENHEGGTRVGRGRQTPKASPAREEPGVDSGVARTTEGRSLDKPTRGSSAGRPAGPMETVGAGQGGTEGQEGRANECSLTCERPG